MDKIEKPVLNSCCEKHRCVISAQKERANGSDGSVCCFTHYNGFENVKRSILIVVKLFCLLIRLIAVGGITELKKLNASTFVAAVSGNGGLALETKNGEDR